MVNTIGASIFFAAAVLWLFLGTFFYKKNNTAQPGITWIVLLIILLNCYHCFAAAIMDTVHIPVNLFSVGIADIPAGAFFWYRIWKRREKQNYEFAWIDLIFVITVVAVMVKFAQIRYGGGTLYVNYLTIDPANHFRAAMDVVNTGTITSMFYETVWNGLFIELLSPLSALDYCYRWFVLSDVINLGLSAMIFYGIVRRHFEHPYIKVGGYILSLIYMVGYPMCSTIYGFVYLGMGVTVIGMLIIVTDMFLKDEMGKWLNIIFLMLGCLAIFECYVMFMPVTFVAIILCVFVKQKRRKCLVSKDTVFICLAIFLIPCIIGFTYTYLGIFTEGVTVSSAIVNEGACYRDLYSNFLPWIPLALFGFWGLCRKKENRLMLFLMPISVAFTLYLFFKTVNGMASTYYYYKMYFMLWLIALVLAFYGIAYAEKQARVLITGCFFVWCVVAGMSLFNIEERIKAHSDLMVSSEKASSYNDILTFNRETMGISLYSPEREELYHYVYQELLMNGVDLVPMAGYWEDDLWYQAITNQRYYGWGTSDPDHTDYFNHLFASDATYICVMTDSQFYADEQEYFDSLERIYENAVGFVAKLK